MKHGSADFEPKDLELRPTALSTLLDAPGAVGGLVRAYARDSGTEDGWLDSWFLKRTRLHCESSVPEVDQFEPITVEATQAPDLSAEPGPRLVSIRPHYFRGFKNLGLAIDLTGDLIVIEGKNSTGKTSLAEALEFLFQGTLSRREDLGEGNPRELENCIGNQFRPIDECTFVEATFVKHPGTADAQEFVVKRILTKDYGDTNTSNCESKLLKDGSELSKEDEASVLDDLLRRVPPLLMQHTLRSFVHNQPSQRRQYFERILDLNDLTDLIGKAVIGNAKLPGFTSPNSNAGLLRWQSLIAVLNTAESKTAAKKVKPASIQDQSKALVKALIEIAKFEFSSASANLADAESWIDQLQLEARQASFPPLAKLQPKQQPNHDFPKILIGSEIRKANIEKRWTKLEEAKTSTNAVRKNAQAIADALESMTQAGLIDPELAVQVCPLCEHGHPPTLTQKRLREICGWQPLVEAEKRAKNELESEIKGLKRDLSTLISEADNTLPKIPDLDPYLKKTSGALLEAASKLVDVRSEIDADVRQDLSDAQNLIDAEPGDSLTLGELETYVSDCTTCIDNLKHLPSLANKYREALRSLEVVVGQAASSEEEYRKRQTWLDCAKSQSEILDDFSWEMAKVRSQNDLKKVRSELMQFRENYLEGRRTLFSDGLQDVWYSLRGDTYSSFSNLQIPKPKGKGFPVLLEVKATLDDGLEIKEVDALKVFSESQVNALGVAAFVTRSRLLGHGMLVFDDPVQSMDEDHFKTFVREMLPPILDEGRQVILLTHNETFAREVSVWHHERPGYVTLQSRVSKKDGCLVDEGNRRINERLHNAEKLADNGKLNEAWIPVRLAIERLYLLTKIKHGQNGFDPVSWKDQTADYMWGDGGVGDIITGIVPDAGPRLKEILDMTSGGAHDKDASGITELKSAVKYLNKLRPRLKISD